MIIADQGVRREHHIHEECGVFGVFSPHTDNLASMAYSLVISSPSKLIAVRDPYGFRPLCMGQTKDGKIVIASESCALDAVGAGFIRDIDPGEIVTVSRSGIQSDVRGCGQKEKKLCAFEYIYFARPDSVLDGSSVSLARQKAGVSIKLNPIVSIVKGKRVVLIDDSIVRGTTCRGIIQSLRNAGAKEIHMRVSAPPFVAPCYYGTDIDSTDDLIAAHHSIKEIADIIGVDSLGYLSVEHLMQITSETGNICTACFGGKYPTVIPVNGDKNLFEKKLKFHKEDKENER